MATEGPIDRWSDGEAYEAYVGRWSRLVAREFLSWLAPRPGLRWLDVGAGTGALSTAVLQLAEPAAVVGVDASVAYVELAQRRVDDPRARFEHSDARELAYGRQFDVAVSGLMLNFVPDAATVLHGMQRAVVPAGVVATYVWDYAGGIELMRHFWDAAVAVDESARQLDEAARFPLCQPDALMALWNDVGLESVETTALEVATEFTDFEDYWSPFLGGQGAAPAYLVSLPVAQREQVRETIRATLPIRPDGSISLMARAWAVKGRTPVRVAM